MKIKQKKKEKEKEEEFTSSLNIKCKENWLQKIL
jgi:hypothetical protein